MHLKHKISMDELDLSRQVLPINTMLHDIPALVDLLFTIVTNDEIEDLKPSSLKVRLLDPG